MVSVITPSIRPEALDIVRQGLLKQSFKDWEWLIGSPFDPKIKEARWIKDEFTGGFWTLNRIYNALIAASHGELIVSWQDSIWVPQDGLQKFDDAWNEVNNTSVISGVGDQYAQLSRFGKPEVKIWSDPRKTDRYGSFYECTFPDVEWNWCAIPKVALEMVGGFDDQLDFRGFGMDGYQVNERLNTLGYKFYLDQSNESFTLRHGRDAHGGEKEWDKNNNLSNGQYEKRREELILSEEWPILHNI
jgi:hypothetical protein